MQRCKIEARKLLPVASEIGCRAMFKKCKISKKIKKPKTKKLPKLKASKFTEADELDGDALGEQLPTAVDGPHVLVSLEHLGAN